ncbi:ABC transporter substrate-binding protein [Piscibacillus halophilus]|uniref:Carbohydrate ABC transporter substrate-binding protein, CUT1 family n=1 Tax=Piscibacillus halophilus TaxID=571933 RepID=A0A1H9KDE8_9BACI|nr:ABC transporter substrate-binding protein [Piscibacillus halophilus]SEQ97226.1 carbohydrate ABC transporter substrate-binding protein, CUT1 family [Piscibacillus halophilus]
MKKLIFILLSLVLIAACSSDDEPEVQETEDGKKLVTFWHAMGGGPGEAIDAMVEDFNNSQEDIHVEAVYQGSYEELLNQLRAVGGTEEAPSLVQVYEVGTKYMSESGFIEPVQKFIDEHDFDISSFEENILGYYQLDGELYSMPFNTSNAIMFYNKDMFREAGLDPDNPPQTFSEVKEAAEALTVESNGGTEVHGFSILIYGWFFEQLLANQGAHYISDDNGRSGPGDEVLFNDEAGLTIFEWLKEMHDAGTLGNYGRNWDDIRSAFAAEKLAMYLDSTAATRGNVESADFEVGTAYLPVPDGMEPQGVIVGGGSLWMTNGIAKANQDAAFEFIKFATSAEQQAKWAGATGYFPITSEAYDEAELQDVYDEYPQFLTSVEQLQNTTLTPATQGALMGVFPEARSIVENSIEALYQGEDPQELLDQAAADIEEAIQKYNRLQDED